MLGQTMKLKVTFGLLLLLFFVLFSLLLGNLFKLSVNNLQRPLDN